ncbi:MAG: thiamine phosphate synthase [Pseudomonadota bacterium]
MALDLSVYLVLGPETQNPIEVAKAAERGGVGLVQWRDKSGNAAAQVEAVAELVNALTIPVVVNDRADVAVAAGAAGVHVGHGDIHPTAARHIVGPDGIVGLTIHTQEEARAARGAPIDYASVGGVFATKSKINSHPPIGIGGFLAISELLRNDSGVPVIAIAGIDADRAAALAKAGAAGVAVMSAITKAADAEGAARALRGAVEATR